MNNITSIYEAQRNALIPRAVAEANEAYGAKVPLPVGSEEYEAYCAGWNRVFHAAMERFWKDNRRQA